MANTDPAAAGGPRPTLREIVIDPAFAGLHWSIPKDTPEELRESAHVSAALAAKSTRDVRNDRTLYVLTEDPARARVFVGWPNGSMTWESWLTIHNDSRWIIEDGHNGKR